jgi:hypothetical protein
MDAPENLDAGEDIETTVQPAAIWHRIHMTADDQRPIRRAAHRRPEISRLIWCNLERQPLKFFPQPCPRLQPRARKRHALGAVVIASKHAQLLQFGHGPLRIKQGVHALWERLYAATGLSELLRQPVAG